ncbi:Aste57867_25272 [Aphanomyces stellatus]|uniref:Aste57867_25272 protein n=1 Tax=Aphanomyces stellatus TaxID=120398 RepID=A0A485LSS8_9STRA|nr:hypothetical protein As57867_025194 [Aphanomyces stellatus]VFU01898.1 Aste57867_25272 [Aphanomyces stellatus]
MVRGKPQKGGGVEPEKSSKGKGKAKAHDDKPTSTNIAKRLTSELQRLRGTANGDLDSAETTALGREFTSETNLEHSDPHVRLLVASCVTELLRVTAPETPFGSEHELYEVFLLIVRVLRETTKDTDIAWFGLLETLATVKMCNLAVGLEPESGDSNGDLVVDLFRCLFERIQDDHSAKVEANMVSIMVGCLEECDVVSPTLLETVLEPLLHSDEHPRAYHMAQQVIEKASDQLQNALSLFFNSVLVDATSHHHESELKDHAHALIYETHKIQPSLLLYVLPNVCLQLQVDEMETRSNAIALMGRLFASSHADYGAQYMKNFREFLGRFRDVKKEIRLQMVQVCSIIAQRKPDLALLIDAELLLRLQDPEWEVRRVVVNEICDLAAHSLTSVSQKCLREVGERMKDKKVIIRKEAMTGLAQIYAAHVSTLWSSGASAAAVAHELAWIPDYVLKCFAYPQQELRLRVVQLLDDILLPKQASDATRMKGLLFLWKQLDAGSKEALRRIFLERTQCRAIVLRFIHLKQQLRGGKSSADGVAKAKQCLKDLNPLLPETEGFATLVDKLVTWKDMKLVKHLGVLCGATSESAAIRSAREDIVKMVGSKTPLGDFVKNVCRKLAMTTLNSSSLGALLSLLEDDATKACVDVLHLVGASFPYLLVDHLSTLETLLDQSIQVPVVLDLLVSFTKHADNVASAPASLKKPLVAHCTTASPDVVKKSARVLVKLFPGEIPSIAKKLLKTDASLSDAKLQTLVVLTKHVSKVVPDAAAFFAHVMKAFDAKSSKRDTKCLALTLLAHLVLYQDAHVHCRQVLTLCLDLLQSSTTKAAAPLRIAAACNLLKLTRVPALESQLAVAEWHALGYALTDPEESVRRAVLKKLTANLVRHQIAHKYLCVVALAASDPSADLKKDARTLLQTAVQRMRRMYEARSDADNTASSLMVPEYALPYCVHLVLHSPWEGECDVDPLFFLLESLVSHVASEADNISFLLQILHKMSMCHDATAGPTESSAKMYKLMDACTSWLKKRIKTQINLKAYPGQIYLPKQLFQPGKKGARTTKDDDDDDTEATMPKEKKRPPPVATEKSKKPKTTASSPTKVPTPAATPTRRMPSRHAKSDANLADQDSDVEEMQAEAPPKPRRASVAKPAQEVVISGDEESDEEDTKESTMDDEEETKEDEEEETKEDEEDTKEDETPVKRSLRGSTPPSRNTTTRTNQNEAMPSRTSAASIPLVKKNPKTSKPTDVEVDELSTNDEDEEMDTPKGKKRTKSPRGGARVTKKAKTTNTRRSAASKKVVEDVDNDADEPEEEANEDDAVVEDEEMTSFRSRRRR